MLVHAGAQKLTCVVYRRLGRSTVIISGTDTNYIFFWIGNTNETSVINILLLERWTYKATDEQSISDQII